MNKHTENKLPDSDAVNRLLLAKDFLDRIRNTPSAAPDRYTIAQYVIMSHNAAELAIAAIAQHLDAMPPSNKIYLMDYFGPIKAKMHKDENVTGKDFFSQLNHVRNGIKHNGTFPDPKQWSRVAEKTYGHISDWCKRYLNLSFDELDESKMIYDTGVKRQYDIAKTLLGERKYEDVLRALALALHSVFHKKGSLRQLVVGKARAEDAIKLSAFGVHANDYLAFQEFLPLVSYSSLNDEIQCYWDQKKYGHAANWRQDVAEFCLRMFLSVVLRTQDIDVAPFPVNFDIVYEHKVTALTDDVEILAFQGGRMGLMGGLYQDSKPKVIHVLKKGESIRGTVSEDSNEYTARCLLGEKPMQMLQFTCFEKGIFGEIEKSKVSVVCVPKDDDIVRDYFQNLPDLEYQS